MVEHAREPAVAVPLDRDRTVEVPGDRNVSGLTQPAQRLGYRGVTGHHGRCEGAQPKSGQGPVRTDFGEQCGLGGNNCAVQGQDADPAVAPTDITQR